MTALARLDDDRRELLARTICVGASQDELDLFFQICERTGLDPFARQIYAVKRWDSRSRREVMQTQVSIDGFRLVAQRSGEYAGQTAVAYCGQDGAWVDVWLSDEPPAAARVGVYRKGFVEATAAVAVFREYAQRNKEGALTSMWAKMPTVMIAKCCEALALRKAFPAELSGLYTAEEMSQQDNPPVVAPIAALPAPKVAEPATTVKDESAPVSAPKTTRKRKAVQEVAAPVSAPATDSYPDEYEGVFLINRVVHRPGKSDAIQAAGEHGTVWIATTIREYADLAEHSVNGELRLEIARVGGVMTIMRVIRSQALVAAPVSKVLAESEELPF